MSTSSINSSNYVNAQSFKVQEKELSLKESLKEKGGAAWQLFRYVKDEEMVQIEQELKTLPSENPPGALDSFKRHCFTDAIFTDEKWVLYAMRFFFNGQLSKNDYAFLMLFDTCSKDEFSGNEQSLKFSPHASQVKNSHTFSIIDYKNKASFREDFINSQSQKRTFENTRLFSKEKLEKFYDSLEFDIESGDSIFVIDRENANKELFLDVTYFCGKGENAIYIFTPQTAEKFMRMMEEDTLNEKDGIYIQPIELDLVHGDLSPAEDFENVEKRAVYVPNRYIANPDFVHYSPTKKCGLAIYGHDLHFHILSMQCHIPIKHREFWKNVALQLKQEKNEIACKAYETILDFSAMIIKPQSSNEEMYNSLVFELVNSPDQVSGNEGEYLTHCLDKIIRKMENELKELGLAYHKQKFIALE